MNKHFQPSIKHESLYTPDGYTTIKSIARLLELAIKADGYITESREAIVNQDRLIQLMKSLAAEHQKLKPVSQLDAVTDKYPELETIADNGKIALYDWQLLWLISADLIQYLTDDFGCLGDEDWFFDDLPVTRSLFAKGQSDTIKFMEKTFRSATGCSNPLTILLHSFMNDESGPQTGARLHAAGHGLSLVGGRHD